MRVKINWSVLGPVLGVFFLLQVAGMVWGAFADANTGWFIRQLFSWLSGDEDGFYSPGILIGYKFSIPPDAVRFAGHLLFDAAVPAIVLVCATRIAVRKDGIAPIDFLLGSFDVALKAAALFLAAMWFCTDVNFARSTGVFLFILGNFIAMLMVVVAFFGVRGDVARLQKDFFIPEKGAKQ